MKLNQLTEALAITMWDSSWLRRRYAGGGFESFDRALDELVERGYNAVRIDAFPHMIANAPDGTNSERFLDPPGVSHHKYGFAQWGNQWTVYIYPRRDIVDFLRKCEERGIYVILSTWLKPTIEPRNEWLEGPEDLVRVWDETLKFLSDNNCLNQVVAVDVHNEIPLGACNAWLNNQLNSITQSKGSEHQRKVEFYSKYFYTVLRELKSRWPDIPFSCSTCIYNDYGTMHFEDFDWIDMHMWSENAPCAFLQGTGYQDDIVRFGDPHNIYTFSNGDYVSSGKRTPADINFEKTNAKIHESWYKNRSRCEEWLEEKIDMVSCMGKKYGIPYGNTEGWATVFWLEHPLLSWDMVKDAGMIAAKLGSKYGYAFNCQSNFCEPQFRTLWADVEYHKQLTGIIRNTHPSNGQ